MDPTQDLAETRKFLASVKEALDRVIDDFHYKRQDTLPTDKPVRDRA